MSNKMKNVLKFVAVAALAAACNTAAPELTKSGLDPKNFESEYDGKPTALYTLTNEAGMEVCITNFGGRIVSVLVKDAKDQFKDVVLGFDKVSDYFPENNLSDFGAAIGRYANRIADGSLVIDDVEYKLPQNNNGHCLHGGTTGWQYKVYEAVESDASHLKLKLESPDGDNGFPGNVTAYVTYTLTPDNKIDIVYEATTDAPTVINMTNHSYFNLSGDPANHTVCEDFLGINADNYTPASATLIPLGEIAPVAGTPLDFTAGKIIGADINSDFEQIVNGLGFDHNWVLNTAGDINVPAVVVFCPETGIRLTEYTTEPGMQVYTGNFLDGTVVGKGGVAYQQRTAICIESQKYPDTPHNPDWPSATLRPGETYSSHTIFAFGVIKPEACGHSCGSCSGEGCGEDCDSCENK